MNFFPLKYFAKTNTSVCSNDFKNKDRVEKINLNFVLSLSDIEKFTLPLSGEYVSSFAILTMMNNDKYYIRESSYKEVDDFVK